MKARSWRVDETLFNFNKQSNFSKYTQSGIHNMAQAGALTPTEKTLIDGLIAVKLEAGTATLAVVMLTRRFSRPENELLDLVAAYPALNLSHVRSQALTEVKSRDWVVEVPSDYAGPSLIQAAPDLHSALSELIPRLEVDLKSLIRQEPPVRVLGHMGTPEIYDTFIIRLQQAQSDIALPMVMTTHELGAIDTLKERANAGVRVRVLRASADLAEEIRGRSAAAQAKERLKGWRAHAKGQRNLEVRITRHARDIRDASSMLIDGNLLRYDIYDNETERTTDGVMIEVAGSSPSNLARMFEDRFNEAWSRARPLGFWRSVGWLLKRWWQVVLFFVFIAGLMLLREEHPGAVSLLLGAMLGYLVNHLDTIFGKVRQIWMRLMV